MHDFNLETMGTRNTLMPTLTCTNFVRLFEYGVRQHVGSGGSVCVQYSGITCGY